MTALPPPPKSSSRSLASTASAARPPASRTDLVDHLQAYRARLLKAGRLLEARAVAHCIELMRRS